MIPSALALLAQLAAPAEAEHYVVDYLTPPPREVVEVGGMDFLSDGTLLVSTRRGRVWWIENALDEDPGAARWHIFAEGLHEGLGLRVVDDEIFVVQRSELSKLIDLDGDRRCDVVETVSQEWGMSGNYHEFAFGLPVDDAGNFYVSTNLGFWSPEWWHGLSKVPWRGWILQIAPDGTTRPFASGVRSPCGLGRNAAGDLFYTDNQGDWMAACGVFHVQEGAFYGHPASLRWTRQFGEGEQVPSSTEPPDRQRTPPALWLPYEWSRSTGNLVEDDTGGAFGPFGGQLFLAELTNGLILRASLEKVRGQYQGASFLFRQQVGSANRVRFAPDGTLFAGFTNRGWGGRAPGAGVARIRWTGKPPVEMTHVRLLDDGFEVELTEPVPRAPRPEEVELREYDYSWWWDYGSPERNDRAIGVLSTELSEDRRLLTIRTGTLRAAKCVRARIRGIGLLHEEFCYTINQLPSGPLTAELVAKEAEPPDDDEESEDLGWLTMTWQDPFGMWTGKDWSLVDAELDPNNPMRLVTRPGYGAIVNQPMTQNWLLTNTDFGDVEFRFGFLVTKGAEHGVFFQNRYELRLSDHPGECGGIPTVKNPRASAYKGPGEWHEVRGRFYAPRFDAAGRKTANARFEQVTIDGVMVLGAAECAGPTTRGTRGEVPRAPVAFAPNNGWIGIRDVRLKPLDRDPAAGTPLAGHPDAPGWEPVFGDFLPTGRIEGMLVSHLGTELEDFELRGRFDVGDGGSASLYLRLSEGTGYEIKLDSTGPGEARTGSLVGLAPITTQLVPSAVPFDLRVLCRTEGEAVHVQVFVNGARVVNHVDSEHRLGPGGIALQPTVAGTALYADYVELKRL